MPKNDSALGRSLIKAHKRKKNIIIKEGYRHTSDLLDGRDFNRLDLKSVTEQTSLDDFLSTTALAENDFNAEFSDVKLIQRDASNILSEEERLLIEKAQDDNKDVLCIPRRPSWDESTSKAELDANERESFLIWRRKLAVTQEEEHLNLTPFEKNLEVWRQLWRVIERSHVIVQILDARNPLLFRCLDLETYVKEVDENKINVLLLNKADFLTESERQCWSDYFEANGVQIAFFSALQQMERTDDQDVADVDDGVNMSNTDNDLHKVKNSTQILSREKLIHFLKSVMKAHNISFQRPTVGLVGYPNVGKSSTINAILMSKKVSVSATPGKTKHFQTFIIDEDLCLCDCPGLVFPNFVSTKADMVINGILPIDQLTEWNTPISLITNLIPRNILASSYSLLIPNKEENGQATALSAEELLNAYGSSRGYMTARGLPDTARSARYILKDFINGKLLYCVAPPGIKQEEYHKFQIKVKNVFAHSAPKENENLEKKEKVLSVADKKFFAQAHVKSQGNNCQEGGAGNKPWKKHNNRNKREKIRRVYHNPYE